MKCHIIDINNHPKYYIIMSPSLRLLIEFIWSKNSLWVPCMCNDSSVLPKIPWIWNIWILFHFNNFKVYSNCCWKCLESFCHFSQQVDHKNGRICSRLFLTSWLAVQLHTSSKNNMQGVFRFAKSMIFWIACSLFPSHFDLTWLGLIIIKLRCDSFARHLTIMLLPMPIIVLKNLKNIAKKLKFKNINLNFGIWGQQLS